MLSVGLTLAALAALLHVYIFWIESVSFTRAGRKVFGVSKADAEVVRPWAFNQGFYNLFLALGTGIGVIRALTGDEAGLSWVDFGLLCMIGAAAVLIMSDRSKARAAAVQGALPLLAMVALGIAHL